MRYVQLFTVITAKSKRPQLFKQPHSDHRPVTRTTAVFSTVAVVLVPYDL